MRASLGILKPWHAKSSSEHHGGLSPNLGTRAEATKQRADGAIRKNAINQYVICDGGDDGEPFSRIGLPPVRRAAGTIA